jgi:hypothetical protein
MTDRATYLSMHLRLAEVACINRLGHLWDGFAPGEVVAPYPSDYIETRGVPLAATFEDLRAELGGNPIRIVSAYRTPAYNAQVGGAKASQHVEGRALDIRHATLAPHQLHAAILELLAAGKLPLLGGLGHYATFVHMDVRPRVQGHVARWNG